MLVQVQVPCVLAAYSDVGIGQAVRIRKIEIVRDKVSAVLGGCPEFGDLRAVIIPF